MRHIISLHRLRLKNILRFDFKGNWIKSPLVLAIFLSSLGVATLSNAQNQSPSQSEKETHRCSTHEYMLQTQQIIEVDEELYKAQKATEKAVEEYVSARVAGIKAPQELDIIFPVVVHILHNNANDSIGEANISEEQVISQIDRLNRDFAGLNEELSNLPTSFPLEFAELLAQGSGIQFCLASIDPDGNDTDGIHRVYTEKDVFSASNNNSKYTSTGGTDVWPRCDYINIWVVPALSNSNGEDVLGYAQLPGGPSNTDGIVIVNKSFGDDTGTSVKGTFPDINHFYKGRTLVHEMGHYFGLKHIWGDDNGACTGSDDVADTPNQGGPTSGCPDFSETCENRDMTMNFLDYTYDECLYMFTQGQIARMEGFINNSGSRSCLIGAFERSCLGGCIADYGDLTQSTQTNVCFNGKSTPLVLNNTNNYEGYQTRYIVKSEVEPNVILAVSDTNIIDFAGYPVGSYGVHPINFRTDSGLLSNIQPNNTTWAGLKNELENGDHCSDLLEEDYPVYTVLDELDFTFEWTCELDALGNNQGNARLSVDVIGGSGDFEYNGPGDNDLLEHGERFPVRVEDSAGCLVQKLGEVDCPAYEYDIQGFNFLNEQLTVVDADMLQVNFNAVDDLPITMSIYDASGQLLERKSVVTREGINQAEINTLQYAPGLYIVVLDDKNERISTKFLRMRR